MNVISSLELELDYCNVAVQHVSHCATEILLLSQIAKHRKGLFQGKEIDQRKKERKKERKNERKKESYYTKKKNNFRKKERKKLDQRGKK